MLAPQPKPRSNLRRCDQIPDNLTFDQAATIPLTLATAGLGLYNKKQQPNGGLALYPPWAEGGRGKYAGQPILVIGGSSSVGQHGTIQP
jgi:NADPH:quinone reductase-like Zn-dependent oxidoreductase